MASLFFVLIVSISGFVLWAAISIYHILGYGEDYVISEKYKHSIGSPVEITGCPCNSNEENAHHVYVSPDGDGDGSKSSPFSLLQAKLTVRKLIPEQQSDIIIHIKDGVYNLDETFTLTPYDSGNNGFSVTWQGDGDTSPIITSHNKISGWEVHDTAKNIWRVKLPEKTINFEHLWLENGTKLQRAWSGFNSGYIKKIHKGIELDKKSGMDFSKWEDPYSVVLIGKHTWYYLPGYVDTFDGNKLYWNDDVQKCTSSGAVFRGNHNILVTHPHSPFSPIGMGKTVAIENAYELISEEGEWYFNKNTKVLYLKPPKGFTQESFVIYPKLKTFIKLDGELYNPIENLIIKNLDFRFNDGNKVSLTASCPTESVYIKPKKGEGALQVNAGNNIRIENNCFKHIGNEALHIDLTGKNITINANRFENIDGTAISIVQSNLKHPETWYDEIAPENKDKIFKNIVVSNNYLKNVTEGNFRHAHGITYSELVDKILITHNEIDGVSGQAIRNTWRYGAVEGGHAQGVVLSWNKTQNHSNKGFIDFGGIYIDCANGPIPNSVHHNYVIGVGRDPRNHPIYLDVHVKNTDVYNNVLIGIPETKNLIFGPFWVAFIGSRDNRAYNNWIEGGNKKVSHFDSKTLFWWKKRNEVFDNTFYKKTPVKWPKEAQKVIDTAGLEPQYKYIRSSTSLL